MGDYILSVSSIILARLRHTDVVTILSQVIDDLVRGNNISEYLVSFANLGARCSSVVRAFARGAMGRQIDPLW